MKLEVGQFVELKNGMVVKVTGVVEGEGISEKKLKYILTNDPKEEGGFFVDIEGVHPLGEKFSVNEVIKGEFTYEIEVGDEVVYGNGTRGIIVYKDELGMILKGLALQEDGTRQLALSGLPPKQELFKVMK